MNIVARTSLNVFIWGFMTAVFVGGCDHDPSIIIHWNEFLDLTNNAPLLYGTEKQSLEVGRVSKVTHEGNTTVIEITLHASTAHYVKEKSSFIAHAPSNNNQTWFIELQVNDKDSAVAKDGFRFEGCGQGIPAIFEELTGNWRKTMLAAILMIGLIATLFLLLRLICKTIPLLICFGVSLFSAVYFSDTVENLLRSCLPQELTAQTQLLAEVLTFLAMFLVVLFVLKMILFSLYGQSNQRFA